MIRLLRAALFAAVVVLGLSWGNAFAFKVLHLVPDDKQAIPQNGSVWLELYPNYMTEFSQHRYFDDGDGHVSVCDHITLTGPDGHNYKYHIEDVSITYKVRYSEGCHPIAYLESHFHPNQSPVGQCWHVVYPPESFCNEKKVTWWQDGTRNCQVDECDNIRFGECDKEEPLCHWHIEEVSLDIRVGDGTLVETTGWSKIKALFRSLF
jgi:hypothetical protein